VLPTFVIIGTMKGGTTEADRRSRRLRRFVPPALRHALRQAILERPVTLPDSTLSPEFEAELWSELAPDIARLRTLVGPEFPLWETRDRAPRSVERRRSGTPGRSGVGAPTLRLAPGP